MDSERMAILIKEHRSHGKDRTFASGSEFRDHHASPINQDSRLANETLFIEATYLWSVHGISPSPRAGKGRVLS